MKLTAELAVSEMIDKNEEEKDALFKLSCEGFESSDVILELEDGRKFKVDGVELMECLARISSQELTTQKVTGD